MQSSLTASAVSMGLCALFSGGVAHADPMPLSKLAEVDDVASAPGRDVIVLRNGGTLRGTLIEMLPGDHASILLASGQTAIVKWDDISRFGEPESAPLPRLEPAAPRNTGLRVFVHIESARHVTLEHKSVGSETWGAVCESPCDRMLPRSGAYRITGSDIVASVDFDLQESADERLVLHVSPGTKSAHYGGMIAFGVGAIAFLGGAIALANSSGSRHDAAGETAGAISVAAGLAAMGIGAYLALAHWSTGQKQELESAREIPARSASLFDTKRREAVIAPAPQLALPILSGSF